MLLSEEKPDWAPKISQAKIRLLTNSFWAAVLMHMVEDAILFEFFTGNHIQIRPGTDWLISPMNGLFMSLLFIAVGVGLRQFRKRRLLLAAKSNIRIVSEAA